MSDRKVMNLGFGKNRIRHRNAAKCRIIFLVSQHNLFIEKRFREFFWSLYINDYE